MIKIKLDYIPLVFMEPFWDSIWEFLNHLIGTFQVSSMPQISAGYAVAVNAPILGVNWFHPIDSFALGSNATNAQSSVWQGIGTPSGFPGLTFSGLVNSNNTQMLVQGGFALSNDVAEVGFSYSAPTPEPLPNGYLYNEFSGMPEYDDYFFATTSAGNNYNLSTNYRGWGFSDDVAFPYLTAGMKESVDAQGNRVYALEGSSDVYKHMVMNSTQTNVSLPDTSGVKWVGVTGDIAANDLYFRRSA